MLGKSLENDVPWIGLRNLLQETIGFYLWILAFFRVSLQIFPSTNLKDLKPWKPQNLIVNSHQSPSIPSLFPPFNGLWPVFYYIYIHIYIYIYIYIYTYIYIHIYIYIYIYMCVSIYIIYIYIYMCVSIYFIYIYMEYPHLYMGLHGIIWGIYGFINHGS